MVGPTRYLCAQLCTLLLASCQDVIYDTIRCEYGCTILKHPGAYSRGPGFLASLAKPFIEIVDRLKGSETNDLGGLLQAATCDANV